MGELILIGLGLCNELGISLQGLYEARSCQKLFAEFYTNPMRHVSREKLIQLTGRKVKILSRTLLEEKAEQTILASALTSKVGLLVPGDPMVATTHVDLRIRAEKLGIKTRIVHAASIGSAIAGATGLQSYKFGRTVTIPVGMSEAYSESIYQFLKVNKQIGLHSLILLEVDVNRKKAVTISRGLEYLLKIEAKRRRGLLDERTLVIGAARIGCEDSLVKADLAGRLGKVDFGPPPHVIVLPGKLHFMEAEALKLFAGAPEEALEGSL